MVSPAANGADGPRHVIEFHDVAFSVKTKANPNKVRTSSYGPPPPLAAHLRNRCCRIAAAPAPLLTPPALPHTHTHTHAHAHPARRC